jgi:hypothetical protein
VTTERQKTALEEFDAVALVVTCLQRALAATLDPDGATADLLETCALGDGGEDADEGGWGNSVKALVSH